MHLRPARVVAIYILFYSIRGLATQQFAIYILQILMLMMAASCHFELNEFEICQGASLHMLHEMIETTHFVL